jgi:hypothetical protein
LEPLFTRAARRYLPSLYANAKAVAAGQRHFSVTLDAKDYPGLTAIPFHAWRRAVLQRDLAALEAEAATIVRATLSRAGCLEWLERDGVLPVHYPEGDRLPLCAPRHFGLLERLRFLVVGTPHHGADVP